MEFRLLLGAVAEVDLEGNREVEVTGVAWYFNGDSAVLVGIDLHAVDALVLRAVDGGTGRECFGWFEHAVLAGLDGHVLVGDLELVGLGVSWCLEEDDRVGDGAGTVGELNADRHVNLGACAGALWGVDGHHTGRWSDADLPSRWWRRVHGELGALRHILERGGDGGGLIGWGFLHRVVDAGLAGLPHRVLGHLDLGLYEVFGVV